MLEYVDWKNVVDSLETELKAAKRGIEINTKMLDTAKKELSKCKPPKDLMKKKSTDSISY